MWRWRWLQLFFLLVPLEEVEQQLDRVAGLFHILSPAGVVIKRRELKLAELEVLGESFNRDVAGDRVQRLLHSPK